MKSKTTKIKLLFSLAVLTFLSSCNDYEDPENKSLQQSNLKSYYIKGSQAKKVASKFASQYNKTLQTSGTTFRTAEGITIDYESVLVVENQLEHNSYTFKVNSPEESETVFQNIAMIEKPNQTVTKLITYEMSDDFAAQYTADLAPMSKFKGTITVQTIAGEDCCSQSEIIAIEGGGGGDSAGGSTSGNDNGQNGNSNGGSTGGWGLGLTGGGGSGTSGTGGGGSGGTGYVPAERCPSGMHIKGDTDCRYTKKESGASSPVISKRHAAPTTTTTPNSGTPPEICCIYDIGLYEEAMYERDCEKLKKLSEPNKQNINSDIDWLKQKVRNNTPIEWGVEFKQTGYDDPDTPQDEVLYENFRQQGVENSVPLFTGGKYIGGAHCHTEKGYGIYSFGDIDFLLDAYKRAAPQRNHLVSFMLICNNPNDPLNPNVYSITVTEIAKLQAARDAIWDNPKYAITPTGNQENDDKVKMDKIHNALKFEYKENEDNLEKYFLQKFGNFGISLYKADNDMSNWNQLELATDANNHLIVQPKPCN